MSLKNILTNEIFAQILCVQCVKTAEGEASTSTGKTNLESTVMHKNSLIMKQTHIFS